MTVRISVPKDVNYKKLIHAMNEPREEVMATVPLDMSWLIRLRITRFLFLEYNY